jgi:uncharacterized membrane protein YhaH (DUF805 family)
LSYILEIVVADGIEGIFLLMYSIIFFAILWIYLAQSTKRCHDINCSGWYQLIPFFTIYLLFAKGDIKRNIYDPNPKYGKEEII